MKGVHERWPLTGRDAELDGISGAVLEQTSGGALIIGPAGMGKTVLAQHAALSVANDFELVYVRGSVMSSAISYGALNFVLSDLDDSTVQNPLLLLRALQELYELRADGRGTLMIIDNAENLDSASAMVISHLVRVGALKVFIICQGLDVAPAEFFDLWKDDLLRRVDVAPLSLKVTTELLTAALAAPVSRSAAVSMWRTSGGNPLFLQAVAKEDIESGYLHEHDGVWVSSAVRASHSGKTIADWISVRISKLPPKEREVLELLAVVGVLPLSFLLRMVEPDYVDNLQEQGVIELDVTGVPLVRIANSLIGDVVRSLVPLVRSRELLRTLTTAAQNWPMPAISHMAYVSWCLDSGAEIDDDALVSAARLANRHFDTCNALRFLAPISNPELVPGAMIEEARAKGIEGDTRGGMEILEKYLTLGAPALEEWTDGKLLLCRFMVRDHSRHLESKTILDEIRCRLRSETTTDEDVVASLRVKTESVAIELHAYNGHFADLITAAEKLLVEEKVEDAQLRHQICSWMAEALSMTGRQDEALQLALSVVHRTSDASDDPLTQEAALVSLYKVMLVSGSWKDCRAMLMEHEENSGSSIYDGSTAELADGCLFVYAGRGAEALDKLLPALSQLRERDTHQHLMLAEAATACAYAAIGDVQASMRHLDRVDLGAVRYAWQTAHATRYFVLLASTATRPQLDVAQELLLMADEESGQGNIGQELLFLCQAVQLGHSETADRLASSAERSQGEFAEACASYARGVASSDLHALLKCAKTALRLGNHQLARDAANDILRVSNDKPRSAVSSAAMRILVSLREAVPSAHSSALDALTRRERSIAVLVAQGSTNREIAELFSVSVRTVEGHAYQIYSKLGISGRDQLKLIVG